MKLAGLALGLLAASHAAAAESRNVSWRVAAVIDGDTLDLEDGRRVRLAGIEAAKPPMTADPSDGRRWPLAEAASAALSALALGRTVQLRGEAPTDRHGRLFAQLQRDDGVWLQGALLLQGHARVHTRPDSRALAAEMLAAEEVARAAQRGIWRTRVYAVRPADDPQAVRRDRDSFQILEGRVLRVTKTGGEAYLDFGEDWRSDTTVHLGRAALKEFIRAGIDPLSYEGRLVRVRGWVGLRNGPMIDATHPEQIERLEPHNGKSSAGARRPGMAPDPAPESATEEDGE